MTCPRCGRLMLMDYDRELYCMNCGTIPEALLHSVAHVQPTMDGYHGFAATEASYYNNGNRSHHKRIEANDE